MFAILYLTIMLALGDKISSRFYRFINLPHRLATSFLIGLLISSTFTYVAALVYARTVRPLFWANVLYFMSAALIFWLSWRVPVRTSRIKLSSFTKWDWVLFVLFFIFACWLMFATLSFRDGKFLLAIKGWSDFGANLSLVQSFTLGQNFPTTHPFFPGEPIHYHFMFWFQAANLSYLGLNPVWSVNVLSILSLCALLVLITTAAEILFESRAVGRLASVLFLLSSSLYYLPFLRSDTFGSLIHRTNYLPSGYPWRGENWGVLTISVLGYQRHLISGMGILLVVVIFLISNYRSRHKRSTEQAETVGESITANSNAEDSSDRPKNGIDRSLLYASLFSGLLIGLLPFWNSPAFVASLAILGCVFLFFPYRIYVGSVILVSLVLGVPQALMLRTRPVGQALFHWGYTLDHPTVLQVLKYLGWSFGLKWVLIAVALIFLKTWHRKLFLAFSSLLPMVFLFQLSVDAFNNHKLLNIWAIFASMYAGFGLWRLAKIGIVGVALSIVLVVFTTLGGVIDLFPIHMERMITVPFRNDRLTTWLLENTQPSDLFLSQTFLSHPILFSGRKIFLGNTLFAWTAGYAVDARETTYTQMFEERDPNKLIQLLNKNKIAYVAIDNGVRQSHLITRLNEAVYAQTFEKVFEDNQKQYDELSIYKVSALKSASNSTTRAFTVSPFVGGHGDGLGEFERPLDIAVDQSGNFYVSDTGNHRVQKFSASGEFLGLLGESGDFREPNGVAIDTTGNIYISDAGKHRLIKFRSDGTFEQEWTGPAPGFFGPRGIAVGSNGEVYVVDQGRARIVKLTSDGQSSQWGSHGSGDGEFLEPTAVAVFAETVYVADAQNGRIQVFDSNGKFLNKWNVPEWQKSVWQYPGLIVDSKVKRLYASSTVTNDVIVFDLSGRRLLRLTPTPPEKFEGPSGLALANNRMLYVVNSDGVRISRIPLQ